MGIIMYILHSCGLINESYQLSTEKLLERQNPASTPNPPTTVCILTRFPENLYAS